MDRVESVQYTLDAIESVRSAAKAALDSGDLPKYKELMGNLWALELCLVSEAQKLLEQLDKKAA